MIRYCTRCIYPDTKPDLQLDEEGVCSACRSFERRAEVDWNKRQSEFLEIVDLYRSKDSIDYDCVVPVSGGKVVVNTAALNRPELIREISDRFGSQCIVVSIDARSDVNDGHFVYVETGTRPFAGHPAEVARRSEAMGAGEILITSIDRDGSMEGYDLELIRRISEAVTIPVIASGGAGNYDHMAGALEAGASAVAAASIFHFTEQTPREAKRHLRDLGYSTRL